MSLSQATITQREGMGKGMWIEPWLKKRSSSWRKILTPAKKNPGWTINELLFKHKSTYFHARSLILGGGGGLLFELLLGGPGVTFDSGMDPTIAQTFIRGGGVMMRLAQMGGDLGLLVEPPGCCPFRRLVCVPGVACLAWAALMPPVLATIHPQCF